MGAATDIIKLLILNVVLPTADIYTDVRLVITLMKRGHYMFGLSLIAPIFLNCSVTWFSWWKMEKLQVKKWTWILVILQIWPQYRAMRVIFLFLKGNPKAINKKADIDRDLGGLEPFLESVPTVFVCTVIRAANPHDEFLSLFIGHGYNDVAKFNSSYMISLVSSAMGMAKFLHTGPSRMFPQTGHLGGYLTWRYIVLAFAIGFTFAGKVMVLRFCIFVNTKPQHIEPPISDIATNIITFSFINLYFQCFLAVLLLHLSATSCMGRLKTMSNYPALVLMPVFTFLTFAPKGFKCCGHIKGSPRDNAISFSKRWTMANMILSVISAIGTMAIHAYSLPLDVEKLNDDGNNLNNFLGLVLPVPTHLYSIVLPIVYLMPTFLGVAFTLIFLTLDRQCCFGSDYYEYQYLHVHTLPNNIIEFEFYIDPRTESKEAQIEKWIIRQETEPYKARRSITQETTIGQMPSQLHDGDNDTNNLSVMHRESSSGHQDADTIKRYGTTSKCEADILQIESPHTATIQHEIGSGGESVALGHPLSSCNLSIEEQQPSQLTLKDESDVIQIVSSDTTQEHDPHELGAKDVQKPKPSRLSVAFHELMSLGSELLASRRPLNAANTAKLPCRTGTIADGDKGSTDPN